MPVTRVYHNNIPLQTALEDSLEAAKRVNDNIQIEILENACELNHLKEITDPVTKKVRLIANLKKNINYSTGNHSRKKRNIQRNKITTHTRELDVLKLNLQPDLHLFNLLAEDQHFLMERQNTRIDDKNKKDKQKRVADEERPCKSHLMDCSRCFRKMLFIRNLPNIAS